MQFTIQDFPETERYFLMELSYFDIPNVDFGDVSFLNPIPLSDIVASLDHAENSARKMISEYEFYLEKAIRRLRMMFDRSPYLQEMQMVGYINDNEGVATTTDNQKKSGLVAQAYCDKAGNVILTYRGFESSSISSALRDYGSQFLVYLGIVPLQFKRADQFFKEIAANTKGNLIVTGDKLGGSLALYTYIKEKEAMPNLTGLASNGNKEALLWKELRVGKYITTGDFIFKRRVKKEVQQELTEHMFRNIDMIRRQEKSSFYNQTEEYFHRGQEYDETLMPLVKILKDYTKADAVSVWFRHEDKNGEYVIPYLVFGNVLPGLKHLKLREGETVICSAAFLGVSNLFPDLKITGMFSYVQTDGEHESMMCIPILCEGKPIGAIHLSKVGENWRFDDGAYGQAVSFGERLGGYLRPYKKEIFYDDDYFIQIFDRTIQKPVFSIMEYENRSMECTRKRVCEGIVLRLNGQNLESGEVIKYKGVCYTKENIEEYQDMMRQDMGILFEKEFDVTDSLSDLMEPYCKTETSHRYLEELEHILHFGEFKEKVFEALTVKEKLIFHTVMCFIKRPQLLVVYPQFYSPDQKLTEWLDSVIRYLAAGQKMTVLKFVIKEC